MAAFAGASAAKCYKSSTWVKQDEAIASNEVQPTASSLAAEQEHKLVVLRVIELFDQLLALVDAGAAIQAHKGVLHHIIMLN